MSYKRILNVLAPLFLIGLAFWASPVLAAENSCGAGVGCWFAWLIGYMLSLFIYGLGYLLSWAVGALVYISQYNHFVDSPAVDLGWAVVRDISNMFFVLLLLIISFGTILHLEQYQMKRLLPKVLLMAVLVNFSKVIAGVFIDFSQIVMLTFVSAYEQVGPGNLLRVLNLEGISNFSAISSSGDETALKGLTPVGIMVSYMFGFIIVVVSLVVVMALMIILVVRMVALWILVVFSPFAYVLSVVPMGQKYASMWWEHFTKYLIVGPVMAFLLWLSLASLTKFNEQLANDEQLKSAKAGVTADVRDPGKAFVPNATPTDLISGDANNMIGYIVAIAMLMMSLVFAQSIGGAVGKIAGTAYNNVTNVGSKALKWPVQTAALRGVTRAASSERVERFLEKRAASNIPFVGRLAQRTYTTLRGPQKRAEEDAKKFASTHNNPRMAEQYMRLYGNSKNPAALARVNALKDRFLSQIPDQGEFNSRIRKMNKGDFTGMPKGEQFRVMRRLYGQGDPEQANGAIADLLNDSGNREFRGLAREARQAAGTNHGQDVNRIINPAHDPNNPNSREFLGVANFTVPGNVNTRYRAGTGEDENQAVKNLEPLQKETADGDSVLRASTVVVEGDQVHVGATGAAPRLVGMAADASAVAVSGYDANTVSGAKSLAKRLKQTGSKDNHIRLATDFGKLGLDQNAYGAAIASEDRPAMASKIMDMLRTQAQGGSGQYSEEELGSIEQALNNPNLKGLTLLNRGRQQSLTDTKESIAHETMHGQLEAIDPSELKEIWESIPQRDREEIKQAAETQGWRGLSDDALRDEYLAEGLKNASRFSSAKKVQETQKAITAAGGSGEFYKTGGEYEKNKGMYLSEKDLKVQTTMSLPQNILQRLAELGVTSAKASQDEPSGVSKQVSGITGQAYRQSSESPSPAASNYDDTVYENDALAPATTTEVQTTANIMNTVNQSVVAAYPSLEKKRFEMVMRRLEGITKAQNISGETLRKVRLGLSDINGLAAAKSDPLLAKVMEQEGGVMNETEILDRLESLVDGVEPAGTQKDSLNE